MKGLSDEQVLDLLNREARKPIQSQHIQEFRDARKTRPQLYKEWVRYLTLIEGEKFSVLFPGSVSAPDLPWNSPVNSNPLIYDDGQWRVWIDKTETVDMIVKNLGVLHPSDLENIIRKTN